MVNEIHSGSLLKRAAIMLPQQFLEMLDRLRLESMQHPQQSMGKSKLFPGAAIAMLHYPQSAPCPSIPCAPFPKRWRSQSEREWAGRARWTWQRGRRRLRRRMPARSKYEYWNRVGQHGHFQTIRRRVPTADSRVPSCSCKCSWSWSWSPAKRCPKWQALCS